VPGGCRLAAFRPMAAEGSHRPETAVGQKRRRARFCRDRGLAMLRSPIAGCRSAQADDSAGTLGSGGESSGAGDLRVGLDASADHQRVLRPDRIISCGVVPISACRTGRDRQAVPGHDVAVIPRKAQGDAASSGQIAVKRRTGDVPDTGAKPRRTAQKFIGDWMTTGDHRHRRRRGLHQFVGPDDDVITSTATIGTGRSRTDDQHPGSACYVIHKPDPVRTEM